MEGGTGCACRRSVALGVAAANRGRVQPVEHLHLRALERQVAGKQIVGESAAQGRIRFERGERFGQGRGQPVGARALALGLAHLRGIAVDERWNRQLAADSVQASPHQGAQRDVGTGCRIRGPVLHVELAGDVHARPILHGADAQRGLAVAVAEAGYRIQRQGKCPALAELLIQKSQEEHGHERWLLSDLKNLGWSAEQVERTEHCPAVAAYVAWNRYTTQCGAPTAFLGTAYVLEYLSVQRASATVERLLAANTIPNIAKAVTFLRGHGQADGEHVAELTSALRSLTDRESI
ncbi:heme oxygenase related enzyme, putative, partial [Stigmatella aurantiaca DW4/3-1]